jgi:hypothetical protein
MINRKGGKTTVSYNRVDLSKDTTVHSPGLNGFMFGVGVSDAYERVIYDETLFTIEISQGVYNRDGIDYIDNSYNLGKL